MAYRAEEVNIEKRKLRYKTSVEASNQLQVVHDGVEQLVLVSFRMSNRLDATCCRNHSKHDRPLARLAISGCCHMSILVRSL
jgi:hypothetical protein